MWDRASLVDHALASVSTDVALMALLGANDALEEQFRRLASAKYKQRTGDRAGAAQMLAIHAPGGSTDVAPGGMVKEATEHSKIEWLRADRVQKGRGRGRVSAQQPHSESGRAVRLAACVRRQPRAPCAAPSAATERRQTDGREARVAAEPPQQWTCSSCI